jgi:hypothetical protein
MITPTSVSPIKDIIRPRAARRLSHDHGRVVLVIHSHGAFGRAADEAGRHAIYYDVLAAKWWWKTITSWVSPKLRWKAPCATWRPNSVRKAFACTQSRPGHSRLALPLVSWEFDTLLDKAKKKAPARSLVSIDDVGVGETLYVDGGYHIID